MNMENEIVTLNKKVDLILESMGTPGQVESLNRRVEEYLIQSEDPLFTEYLHKMKREIQANQKRLSSLEQDLSRAYSLYESSRHPSQYYFDVKIARPQPKNEQLKQVKTTCQPVQEQHAASRPTREQYAAVQPVQEQHAASQPTREQYTACQPVQEQYAASRPTREQYTAGQSTTMEFKLGAGLLSVIGALFVLVAFVTFGLNFLSGMLQGIFLYLISGAVLCFSELWLYKKNEKFSLGITGLGIASLYVSTIINYLYLQNFGGLTAIILTLVIAGIALLISRKRDSGVMRIICFTGCYICFFPLGGFKTELDFIVITSILFIVNMACIFYPVHAISKSAQFSDDKLNIILSGHKNERLILMIHMACNTFLTILLTAVAYFDSISELYVIFYLMTAIIIANTIFCKLAKNEVSVILHCFQIFIYDLLILFVIMNTNTIVLTLILAFSISTLFFYLENTKREKWIHLYHFILLSLACVMFSQNVTFILWYVLGTFILIKAISMYRETEILNGIVTVITMLVGLTHFAYNEVWLYCAAILASIILIRRWHYFYQITIILFTTSYLFIKLDDSFLPVATAIFCILLYMMPRLKNLRERKNTGVYYLMFSFLAFFYLMLAFRNQPAIFGLMVLLGLLICFAFVRPAYGIKMKKNDIVISIFLTYMTLICKAELSIVISIILMIIAMASVGTGFLRNERIIRRYGLFLSLFVCAKLVFYDFLEVESLQRILLFLIVGIIALGISFLYLYLEKRLKNNMEEAGKYNNK